MKDFIRFVLAITLSVLSLCIFTLLNLPMFLCGWFSCMAFYITLIFTDKLIKK